MTGKVCVLTTVHRRDDVRIFRKEIPALAQAGYDVTACVADGLGDADCGNYRVVDVGRAPGGRWGRLTWAAWRVFRLVRQLRPDVVHFHDPELLWIGALLRLYGQPVIYDVHEDLPRQTLSKHYLPGWLRRPLAQVVEVAENVIAGRMTAIVAATPTIAARFPPSRTALVQNYPILAELESPQATPYRERPHAVVYLGGLARIRGIREMVEAIGLVPTDQAAQLILGGWWVPPELEVEIRNLPGWQAVDFVGYLSRAGVAEAINRARAGLVTLHPTVNYTDSLPIKMFEYLAVGIPVIASDFPLWRTIVESCQCGILVDPLQPQAIADAIEWMLVHEDEALAMGARGREAIWTKMNWGLEAEQLVDQYRRLLGERPAGDSRDPSIATTPSI